MSKWSEVPGKGEDEAIRLQSMASGEFPTPDSSFHNTQRPSFPTRTPSAVSGEFNVASPEPSEYGKSFAYASPYSTHTVKMHVKGGEHSRVSSRDSGLGFGNITGFKDGMDTKFHHQASPSMEFEELGLDMDEMELDDQARLPLSRKIPVPAGKLSPYRIVILLRLVVLGFFFKYRVTHPVKDAYGLWAVSVMCEIWFGLSWILDQFPKWKPIRRETYPERLSLRYEREDRNDLAAIDVFVSTVDPMKEPPLVTANTILSILSVDYPVSKVACYLSDDGGSYLTFRAITETSEFARLWVPFVKKYNVEPRAPEFYFAQKGYLKGTTLTSFTRDRRVIKREYEEFKVRINALVAQHQEVPEEGWIMPDGTPWPGNNTRDHPGMIQVFLGQNGASDTDGNDLPRLIYVSREKRPGFQHHKKAGAMNSLVRVSAVLTNGRYMLNLDCDHYINNSKALREAMCFMMDPKVGKYVCFVQFPQRFDGIDPSDRYANRNTVFFDINMKGLDGLQGPVYVGTGCVFNRVALYGYNPPPKQKRLYVPSLFDMCLPNRSLGEGSYKSTSYHERKQKRQLDSTIPNHSLEDMEGGDYIDGNSQLLNESETDMEKKFGKSPALIASTAMPNGGVPGNANPSELLKEAIQVISCGYEDTTDWGKEMGWIYGSITEDILTGFKMHCRGWKSIYCMPDLPAFNGSAPINLSDRLVQVLRWALGSVEILFSRHCPIWYGHTGKLKWLERLSYINTTVYPITSIPLIIYCLLPAICLVSGKFIIPQISALASMYFLGLFLSIIITGVLEMRWSNVSMEEWWRNEQFWVIGGVSAHFVALMQGLLKVIGGYESSFKVTTKSSDEEGDFSELYTFKWSFLIIPPATLMIVNVIGLAAGISSAVNGGYGAWGPLFGKLFFALWVIVHLYPFIKGLMGRSSRMPTIIVVWSVLLASVISLMWVRINPFTIKIKGPSTKECGILC